MVRRQLGVDVFQLVRVGARPEPDCGDGREEGDGAQRAGGEREAGVRGGPAGEGR